MPESDNHPVLIPRQPLPQTFRTAVTSDNSALRVHLFAIQRWLYGNFFVADGYPIPVTMCSPMDAFSEFNRLWKDGDGENNPFKYLLQLKDANGTPLYEPYPSNIRYPIMTLKFKGMDFRATQSYGTHKFRRISYPTVSKDVKQRDLGNVTNTRRPLAWDFSWQLDHFCNRPDVQAIFMSYFAKAFEGSGGQLETFIVVRYPGYYGDQLCRLKVEGGIVNSTPDDFGESPAEYRTTVNITLEGYNPKLDLTLWPTFWTTTETLGTTNGISPITMDDIQRYFPLNDLRPVENNPNFDTLPNLPPKN